MPGRVRQVSENQQASRLELATNIGGDPVFNFAVARVHYQSTVTPANNVRVFFRMFTTAVTNMVDTREIYFIPMVNPDGHVYVEQNHAGPWTTWWRKNRRDNGNGTIGVDINRNYGYQWGYDNLGSSPLTSSQIYRGGSAFSEPETQAIRDFCIARNFSVGFSYHSYGELLLYGWGYIYDYTPDHDVFLAMGDSLISSNGYFAGNPAMGAIYVTNGDTDD